MRRHTDAAFISAGRGRRRQAIGAGDGPLGTSARIVAPSASYVV
jgi:hypothetical protein